TVSGMINRSLKQMVNRSLERTLNRSVSRSMGIMLRHLPNLETPPSVRATRAARGLGLVHESTVALVCSSRLQTAARPQERASWGRLRGGGPDGLHAPCTLFAVR